MNKREQSIYNIMCAALALFRENGFRDTNVRQIAERADISLGMVNHYFVISSRPDFIRPCERTGAV